MFDTSKKTKEVAENFIRGMLISPDSMIQAQNLSEVPQIHQEQPKLLLMKFPRLLLNSLARLQRAKENIERV